MVEIDSLNWNKIRTGSGNLPRLLVYRPWVWFVRISCSSSSSTTKRDGGGGERGKEWRGENETKHKQRVNEVDVIFSNFYLKTRLQWGCTFTSDERNLESMLKLRGAVFSKSHCSPHTGSHFFLLPLKQLGYFLPQFVLALSRILLRRDMSC